MALTQATTAIIGLGAMGMGMAKNMLDRALPLKGYDLSAEVRDRFAELGGEAVTSIAEAATETKLLIVMVVDAAQVRAVLLGAEAALSCLPAGATVMLCSTIAPDDVRAFAVAAAKADVLLLDAPVSGGKAGADAGSLTVMASGPPAAFTAAKAALAAVSKKVYQLGAEAGIGATYKTVHQLAAGVHLVAAAELLALGTKAGCDPQTLFDIVSSSAGQSWMFNDRAPRMLAADYTPRSMVNILRKDIELVLQQGQALATPLPLSAAAYHILAAAAGMGYGMLDDSAVVKVYENLTGVSLPR